MTEPTFDRDGCPTDETLQFIERWEPDVFSPRIQARVKLTFAERAFDKAYGLVRRISRENILGEPVEAIEFVTGGWSNNEAVVVAMSRNFMLRQFWESDRVGGLHIYEVPIGDDSK